MSAGATVSHCPACHTCLQPIASAGAIHSASGSSLTSSGSDTRHSQLSFHHDGRKLSSESSSSSSSLSCRCRKCGPKDPPVNRKPMVYSAPTSGSLPDEQLPLAPRHHTTSSTNQEMNATEDETPGDPAADDKDDVANPKRKTIQFATPPRIRATDPPRDGRQVRNKAAFLGTRAETCSEFHTTPVHQRQQMSIVQTAMDARPPVEYLSASSQPRLDFDSRRALTDVVEMPVAFSEDQISSTSLSRTPSHANPPQPAATVKRCHVCLRYGHSAKSCPIAHKNEERCLACKKTGGKHQALCPALSMMPNMPRTSPAQRPTGNSSYDSSSSSKKLVALSNYNSSSSSNATSYTGSYASTRLPRSASASPLRPATPVEGRESSSLALPGRGSTATRTKSVEAPELLQSGKTSAQKPLPEVSTRPGLQHHGRATSLPVRTNPHARTTLAIPRRPTDIPISRPRVFLEPSLPPELLPEFSDTGSACEVDVDQPQPISIRTRQAVTFADVTLPDRESSKVELRPVAGNDAKAVQGRQEMVGVRKRSAILESERTKSVLQMEHRKQQELAAARARKEVTSVPSVKQQADVKKVPKKNPSSSSADIKPRGLFGLPRRTKASRRASTGSGRLPEKSETAEPRRRAFWGNRWTSMK